jgi:dTDP-4-amino-4,6-dideoxygalactose transaminase
VIRHARRDLLIERLESDDVVSGLHYPVPVHLQSCRPDGARLPGSLPASERTAAEILSLPLFPGMDEADQRRVSDAVRRCGGEHTRL